MKALTIKLSNERPITPSGLSLVGQMLGKSSFIKKCNNMKVDGRRSQSQIKNGDILLSYIGLLYQGKTAYEDISAEGRPGRNGLRLSKAAVKISAIPVMGKPSISGHLGRKSITGILRELQKASP